LYAQRPSSATTFLPSSGPVIEINELVYPPEKYCKTNAQLQRYEKYKFSIA
jgi:hypothetical protein